MVRESPRLPRFATGPRTRAAPYIARKMYHCVHRKERNPCLAVSTVYVAVSAVLALLAFSFSTIVFQSDPMTIRTGLIQSSP